MDSSIRTNISEGNSTKGEDFILCLVYAGMSVIGFMYFRYHYDVPDMYQYISIAKKYSDGNIKEALNSYWGPLLSWLLIPFILVKADPFFSLKLLQILIGFYTLLLSFRFIESTIPALRFVIKLILIPLILTYALLSPSPDLLFLALLLQIILLSASDKLPLFPLACVGFLLFLTKGVGLYLFPAILILVVLVKFRGGKANPLFYKQAVVSFLTFTIFCIGWMGLLSLKYGEFTAGSAGRYNLNLIGSAKGNNLSWKHPIDNGLYVPFTKTAISAWEEPYRLPQESWSMFRSQEDFLHYTLIIYRNIKSLFYVSFGRHAGTVAFLGLIIFAVLKWTRKPKTRLHDHLLFKYFPPLSQKHLLLLLTAILVSAGYSLILVMPRYVWINTIAAILLFSVLAEIIFKLSKPWGIILTVLMLISVLVDLSLTAMRFHRSEVEETYRAAVRRLPSGPFAGIQDPEKKTYAVGCLMSLYSGQPFYGILPRETVSNKGTGDDLQKFRIKELVIMNERNTPQDCSSLPPLDLLKIRQ